MAWRWGALLGGCLAVGCAHGSASRKTTPSSCAPNELPLRIIARRGKPWRLFVDAELRGEQVLFLFDTASAKTYLRHPLDGPKLDAASATVRLGCVDRVLDGRPVRPLEPEAGRRVLGTVGADALGDRVTELDLRPGKGVLRTHAEVPAEARGWPSAPLVRVAGVPVTEATVDGQPARMLLDTGTEETILLDPHAAELGPGRIVHTTDVFGETLELVRGEATLAWGEAQPRKTRLWRTRAFGAFEQQAQQIGGAQGILGLASFGARRVVLDLVGGRVWIEPLPP